MQLLNADSIRAEMGHLEKQLSDLVILDTVDSTNTYLLEKKTLPTGYVVLAEQQTAGRGRLGNTWLSPAGRSIALSMLWHFSCSLHLLHGLSLVTGIAVAHALESYGLKGIKLKWPNDITYEQKKLGGILIDIASTDDNTYQAIIGIGLNTHPSSAVSMALDQAITDISTSLSEKYQDTLSVNRNRLVGLLLRELFVTLPKFQREGLEAFQARWNALDALAGHTVQVKTHDAVLEGRAEGIDALGNLKVSIQDIPRSFHSATVSVRWA